MTLATNQKGYDVISAENERIPVKTVTSSTHVTFNVSTFELVDRIIVLRINIDEDEGVSVETLEDETREEFVKKKCTNTSVKITYRISGQSKTRKPLVSFHILKSASFYEYEIVQYENATINVRIGGITQKIAKPYLGKIAANIGVDILNRNGGIKNTRSLGADIIKTLNASRACG